MGVEKVQDRKELFAAMIGAIEFPPLQLRGGLQSRCYRSAEESHQSLDVLSHRCQEASQFLKMGVSVRANTWLTD